MVDASCQPQKRAGSGARDLCDFMRQNEMDRWTGSGSDLLMNVDRVELRLERCCGGCVFVWKTIKGGPPLSLLSRQLTVRGERGESSDQFDDFIGGAGRRSCLIWPWREFIKFIKKRFGIAYNWPVITGALILIWERSNTTHNSFDSNGN